MTVLSFRTGSRTDEPRTGPSDHSPIPTGRTRAAAAEHDVAVAAGAEDDFPAVRAAQRDRPGQAVDLDQAADATATPCVWAYVTANVARPVILWLSDIVTSGRRWVPDHRGPASAVKLTAVVRRCVQPSMPTWVNYAGPEGTTDARPDSEAGRPAAEALLSRPRTLQFVPDAVRTAPKP